MGALSMNRTAFDQLTPAEQSVYCLTDGKLTD